MPFLRHDYCQIIEPVNMMIDPLIWILGEWKGDGQGGYPGHDPFVYEDHISFRIQQDGYKDEPLVHFEQIARIHDNGIKKFKHWETGFFRPLSKDTVQFYVSHNTGRIEVYKGKFLEIDVDEKKFMLDLQSETILNNQDITPTHQCTRQIILRDNVLSYTHAMNTDLVPQLSPHLRSQLTKGRFCSALRFDDIC